MNQIKVFVADIDNTLRGRIVHTPGKETLQALEDMHKAGILLGIASGRPLWQNVMEHAKEWGLSFQFDFLIGLNGSELYDTRTGTVDHYHLLDEDSLKEIFLGMEPLNLNPFIYKEGYQLAYRPDHHTEMSAQRHGNRVEFVKQMSDFWQEPNAKVLYRVDTAEEGAELEKFGRTLCNDHITCFLTGPELLEFQSPLINKGVAVQKYCEKYGLSMEDVIAFGDAQNDLEMLKMAGKSVCLKNGMDDVKAVCDDVTEFDADHDGAGIYLRKHVLNQK